MVSRVALAGLALTFAVGGWLVAAPFVLRFQHYGAPWTTATRVDMSVGAVLVATGFAGFFICLAGRVRELYADAELPESR